MFEKIIDSIKEYMVSRETRKTLELQRQQQLDTNLHSIKLEKLKIEAEYVAKGKVLPENLDMIAMEQMEKSYKDEIIMAILFTPIILSFFPTFAPSVEVGFKILQSSIPEWYVYLIIGIVVVTFGLRGMLKFLVSKKKI